MKLFINLPGGLMDEHCHNSLINNLGEETPTTKKKKPQQHKHKSADERLRFRFVTVPSTGCRYQDENYRVLIIGHKVVCLGIVRF